MNQIEEINFLKNKIFFAEQTYGSKNIDIDCQLTELDNFRVILSLKFFERKDEKPKLMPWKIFHSIQEMRDFYKKLLKKIEYRKRENKGLLRKSLKNI